MTCMADFLKRKELNVKGILLEKMVPKGVELIVGIQNDSSIWSSHYGWTWVVS